MLRKQFVLPLIAFVLLAAVPSQRLPALADDPAQEAVEETATATDDVAKEKKRKNEDKTSKIRMPKGTAAAIKGSPEIDGKVDEAWKQVPRVRVQQPIEAIQVLPVDEMATATVQFMWDDGHLYSLWRVTDKKLAPEADDDWQQDSVELFLDQDKKRSTSYEEDDAQYRVNCEGKLSGQGTGFDVNNLKAATSVTKSGYIVEMAVDIKHVKLMPGMELGVEMQVNDNAGDGTRGAVAKWLHVEDDSWENTSKFGTLLIK
ncbi:MAG: sugar-binding protein [Pirellulaceae bacterium]